MSEPEDIELKFDGEPVKRLDGAPADAVIASLNALQRMVLIIGTRAEGRALSQRLKPTARVRREYAVVCKAPKAGSHIQPINIASQTGSYTLAAVAARTKLIETLRAFDSGDESMLEKALPNARDRWFMADAAQGLLPSTESKLEISLRAGSAGPLAFTADRARVLIQRYRAGDPPEPDKEDVAGKLLAINYETTVLTIKPGSNRSIRLDYPLPCERWLQANVRRRIRVLGSPNINTVGDITGFSKVDSISEVEPTLEAISHFRFNGTRIVASKPLSIPVSFDMEDRLFIFQDTSLGIDVFSSGYESLRECIIDELQMLWGDYALEKDSTLAIDAIAVKQALLSRFRSER